jgi:hypothetical protein
MVHTCTHSEERPTMADAPSSSTTVIRLPGLGVVVVDHAAHTLTPRSAHTAKVLGMDRPAKRTEDRSKMRLDRRRFEAYATSQVGRPDHPWTWSYDSDS